MKIDTKKEENILNDYYKKCLKKVEKNEFLVMYAQEKLKHSYQVVGAGNYIMRHEDIFAKNKDKDFLRSAKLAYLFHDIGRFEEIEKHFANPNQKHDHSILSYEILKTLPEYAKPEILLPIKHHGHMIEDLYKDEDRSRSIMYYQLGPLTQRTFTEEDIEKIQYCYDGKEVATTSHPNQIILANYTDFLDKNKKITTKHDDEYSL